VPAAAEPLHRPPQNAQVEDYGHFDATTWEIENGQKKVTIAQFQRFPNLGEAFRCHALLLAESPRYAPAMHVLGIRNQGLEKPGVGCQVSGVSPSSSPAPDTQRLTPVSPDVWQKFAERLGPKTSQLDLEHCGYSTNPSYSAELIQLVNLYRLNDPRALTWYATGQDPGRVGAAGSGLGTTPVAKAGDDSPAAQPQPAEGATPSAKG